MSASKQQNRTSPSAPEPQAVDQEEGTPRRHPSTEGFARPCVAVDLVIVTILDADLKLLLIQRDEPPYKGHWALPGGFVRVGNAQDDQGEDIEEAAHRELAEETGLPSGSVFLEQLYTFGRTYRDPRTRVVSVAHYALVQPDLAPFVRAGGDAAAADWFSLGHLDQMSLAFDHEEIIEMALKRIRGKIDYTDIAFELVPRTFTIAELRAVHEIIKGKTYDPGNFRRRFKRMVSDGLIEEAPGKRITTSRPAKVYSFKRGHDP